MITGLRARLVTGGTTGATGTTGAPPLLSSAQR